MPSPEYLPKLRPQNIDDLTMSLFGPDCKLPSDYQIQYDLIYQKISGVSVLNYQAISSAAEGERKEVSISQDTAKQVIQKILKTSSEFTRKGKQVRLSMGQLFGYLYLTKGGEIFFDKEIDITLEN